MDIKDFSFDSKQLGRQTFQTILSHKDGNKFGCQYNSNSPASDHVIFNEFTKNPRNFFIDVDSEVIKDEIVVEIQPPIEIVENKI